MYAYLVVVIAAWLQQLPADQVAVSRHVVCQGRRLFLMKQLLSHALLTLIRCWRAVVATLSGRGGGCRLNLANLMTG